jgi:hypothetical protein
LRTLRAWHSLRTLSAWHSLETLGTLRAARAFRPLDVPLDALLSSIAALRLRDETDELALVSIAIETNARIEDVIAGNLGFGYEGTAGQCHDDRGKNAEGYLGESLAHYGTPVR